MKHHHYNPNLKLKARFLRSNSTRAEIRIWTELLSKKKMGYSFNRQRPIGNYIVDFFCLELKLIIEIDGWTHDDHDQKLKDLDRESRLSHLGYYIILFTDWEIFNVLDEVKLKILNMIEDIKSKES